MSKKRCISYLVYFIILFGIICSGCSKKGDGDEEETVANSNQTIDDQTTGDQTIEEQTIDEQITDEQTTVDESLQDNSTTEDEDTSEETENENDSPWKLVSDSSVTTKVDYAGFINESVGITVGYAGAISYTEDGGKNWSQSSNVSACRYGLDFYDESFIISSGNSGVNLLSADKGKSWTNLADFPLKRNGVFNKFLSLIDKNNIYIGSSISLGVSSDGGLTWKELEVPEECTKISGMFFLTPEIGYLLNSDGTLYKTNNSCESWTTQIIDLSGEKIADSDMPSVAINFQYEDYGMIIYATKSFHICCLRTEDGGSTWETIEMPEVHCLAPYLSRDGQYLTLSSALKRICLYKLEAE